MKVQNDYLQNKDELLVNQYALKSVTSTIIVITIIWLLNVLNIFLVNRVVTTWCFGL